MSQNGDITQVERLARSVDEAEEDASAPDPGTHFVRFKPGDRVGPYRLIFRVGQGGMGDVYAADRADNLYRRRVALKLMRIRLDGRDLNARFDAERRILAAIDHPNIASLIDGGLTEHGIPYVVMEYVDGLAIDRYCQGKRLSIEERVRLFLQVCGAVQYAHRNLIVHRDIKPDNILVTEEGRPVLLDFGIAKLLRPELMGLRANETRAGTQMMTPEFASPEQFRGTRVSTSTDVYSLGALLYVLVTGKLPHPPEGLSPTEFGRFVCDVDPKPPGQAATEFVPHDVEAIILKALRKEPESRYLSVEEMAADLDRYLRGFPVRARAGNWRYHAAKFLRRHRAAAVFSSLLSVVLLASSFALFSFNGKIREERDIAEGSIQFLWDLFDGADPNGSRGQGALAGRALLDDASARLLAGNMTNRPQVRFSLAAKTGDIYRQLGSYDRAAELFDLALRMSEAAGGKNSNDTAATLVRIADLERERGNYEKAEAAAKRSLDIRARLYGRKHPEVADSLNVIGILLQIRGKREEAEAVFREAVAIRRKVLDRDDPLVALSLGNLGNVLRDEGDLAEARKCFEEALEIRRRHWGGEHPKVASSLGQLGQIATAEKQFEEAVRLTEESVRISRKAYQRDNPDLARVLVHYGHALAEARRYDESEAALKEAVEIQRKARGAEGTEVSFAESALASTYMDMKRFDEAERLQRHALAIRVRNLGTVNPATVGAKLKLGNLLLTQRKSAEAAAIFREVLAAGAKDSDRNAAQKGLDRALGRG